MTVYDQKLSVPIRISISYGQLTPPHTPNANLMLLCVCQLASSGMRGQGLLVDVKLPNVHCV